MQMQTIQELYQQGELKQAVIAPAKGSQMPSGYYLFFVANDKRSIKLTNIKDEERIFRSIDSAKDTAKEVGISKIIVTP